MLVAMKSLINKVSKQTLRLQTQGERACFLNFITHVNLLPDLSYLWSKQIVI